MEKMILNLVLCCLCLGRLEGLFGEDEEIHRRKGESVTLESRLTELKDNDQIQWRFGDENTLIAEINVTADWFTVYDDVLDGRFRDRLKLNNETGSLTITNIRIEVAGRYELQIKNEIKIFKLFVTGKMYQIVLEGKSVTLESRLTELKGYHQIQWRFGDENTLIAEINVAVNRFTVYDDVLDGRFRDRLKLNNETGSLTITNVTTEDEGRYELQTNNENQSFKLCIFREVLVKIGDSVTLNSHLTELKDDEVILWTLSDTMILDTLIAEINVTADWFTVYDDVLDGRFRDRLKLNNETGSLTITNIRAGDAGQYNIKTNIKFIYFILTVYVEQTVKEGDSVTLNSGLNELKGYYEIQWRFGDKNTLIAEISQWADRFTVFDDVLDGRFRDRLKLNNETGSLTITNVTTEDSGRYKLETFFKNIVFIFRVYDSVHCCGPTEAVIRLVLSALVGVATVVLLVYEIRSRTGD